MKLGQGPFGDVYKVFITYLYHWIPCTKSQVINFSSQLYIILTKLQLKNENFEN